MKQKLHFQRVFASLLLLTISMLSWAYDFEVNGFTTVGVGLMMPRCKLRLEQTATQVIL